MNGIFTALLTPFNDDYTINEASLKKLVEFNLEKGVNGFYVGGSTGEGMVMSPEERKEVAFRFKAALEALPEQIDVLESIEVGINKNPGETWDVVLTAIVPTMADVEVYAKHPAHIAAAGLLAGHKDMRACVDYEF